MPSQTALAAAAARAAHLIVDGPPVIFADTLAAALLGDLADELIGYHRTHGTHPILSTARMQVVCRSRYAEQRLALAAARGIGQYVILGAGLDSFACRRELAGQLTVFEVDHPATQEWKRATLATAQIPVPPHLVFVPADLAGGAVLRGLLDGGFDASQPAVVSWLGVTMYLDRPAIAETLAALSTCAPGTEVIVDYMLPPELRDETGESYVSQVAPVVAEGGEPWRSFLQPAAAQELLAEHGFTVVEHVRQPDMVPAALWDRSDSLCPVELSMITRAVRSG